MGYFSNGTEGDMYYERWCARCIHERSYRETGEGPGCMVWMIHQLYNYDALDDEKLHTTLNLLIPRSEGKLDNERCTMFWDAERVTVTLPEKDGDTPC